jgi:hypothetical protein
MIKDIRNVFITFSLVALMLYGGSFLYTKKIQAEEMVAQQVYEAVQKALKEQEAKQAEQLAVKQEEERLLAEQNLKAEFERINALKAEAEAQALNSKISADAKAKQQAAYAQALQVAADTKAKQQAVIAEQAALDKARAQQVAAQKAADQQAAQAAVKKSRQSRAS